LQASGKYAYIVGNDGSSDDIYQIELAKMFRPDPVVIVSGTVYNAKTKKPMDAEILFSDITTNKNPGLASSNPSNGSYKIALPAGSVYQFLGRKDGFFPTSENLDLKALTEYTEITKDLYLNPIEVGQVVRLNNLFFDTGKSDLKPESFSELERIIEMLTKNPTLKIEIGGHTDNVGDDAYNKKLSQARADAVINYLLKNNVNTAQMKGVGYGETKPSSPNTTEQGKAMNRRVEFIIKSK
jgi:outer membrane protein OmpA-like peptidoglycan-associated protein